MVIERAIVNQAGGFDETLLNAHDFDLWLRITDMPMVRFTVRERTGASSYYPGSVGYTSRRLNCGVRLRAAIFKLSGSPLHTELFLSAGGHPRKAFRAHVGR